VNYYRLLQNSQFNKVFDQNCERTAYIKLKIQLHYFLVAEFGAAMSELTGVLELKLASRAAGRSPYT